MVILPFIHNTKCTMANDVGRIVYYYLYSGQLKLRVTVCIRKNLQVQNHLYLDKGSSYEAETNTKI